eukprot:GHVP01060462.1.p1 GENE.GHVP01060462.1~~GHVP01060462.1.p1  ORF type:complete len:207 (-),score=35.87 GHVP01060462.1:223-843(-)
MEFRRNTYLLLSKIGPPHPTRREITLEIPSSITNPEEIDDIEGFNLENIRVLHLHSNAYFLLPKILSSGVSVRSIRIDLPGENLLKEGINKIGYIDLGKTSELSLINSAYILLSKIIFSGLKITSIYIDIPHANLCKEEIGKIESIELGMMKYLHLHDDAYLLLPKIQFSNTKFKEAFIVIRMEDDTISEVNKMEKSILEGWKDWA